MAIKRIIKELSESVRQTVVSHSCDLMDCGPSGSFVHGILQARILEWGAIPFSRGSFQPRDWTWISCVCRQILYCLSHQGSSNKRIVWTNLCPTFDNPDKMDQFLERYSLPKLTDQTDYMIKSMCIEEDNNHLSKQSTSCRCVHW